MFLNRLLYIICLCAAGLFFAAYDGWISLYLIVFTLCILPISFIWLLVTANIMRLRINGSTVTAKPADSKLIVHTDKAFLLNVIRMKIEVLDLMYGEKGKHSFEVTDADTYFPLPLQHCGTYQVSILKASVSDPFGLFSLRVKGDRTCSLTVFPGMDIPSDLPLMQELVPQTVRPKPDFSHSDIYEYRDYRPSDPISHINWKLSAKKDSMIIREPQEIAEKDLRILLDLTEERAANDRALARLRGLHERMKEADRKYYLDSPSQGLRFYIENDDAVERALDAVLSTKVTDRRTAPDDYFYVIRGGAAE